LVNAAIGGQAGRGEASCDELDEVLRVIVIFDRQRLGSGCEAYEPCAFHIEEFLDPEGIGGCDGSTVQRALNNERKVSPQLTDSAGAVLANQPQNQLKIRKPAVP
jgi:hypothetical protein